MLNFYATVHGGSGTNLSVDKLPDHCPVCHVGIEALYQKLAHCTDSARLEMVFRCPREVCQSFFIARHFRDIYSGNYIYFGSYPFQPVDSKFSEHILRISPQFCTILNQARKAEKQEWKMIAGPGYRKALEFLIKDYLCLARPKDTEQIQKIQLGPCIENYVDNDKVRATAARAAWLGNDETHYARKWEDKDLNDLKKLVDLTVHWIEMEEMTASVIKDMPEGKK